MTTKKPRGRPRRYSEYDQILQEFPAKSMSKRPVYVNNIGLFRGKTGDTVFLKIFLRHGGIYKGKSYPLNHCLEIPVGKLDSWDWSRLEAERDRLQGKADRNEPLEDKQSITFKEYAERWLENAKTRQRSYLTSKYSIENNFIPAFGHKNIADITVGDINDWQAKRLAEVKPGTALRDKTMLKAVLNCALREGLIQRNPCVATDRIKGIQARLRYWTPEELLKVLNTAGQVDEHFKDYMLWALHSAMRKSEILRMEWADVKRLPNGEIKIHLPISKSDKSRQLPCNEQMLAILTRQRNRVPKEEKRIFPISPKTIQRRIETVRDKAGVEDIRLHDLRTLNITYALVAGVDPKTLTGITGHADLQMIQKHYSVVVDKALNEASKKSGSYIDNLLKDAEENAKKHQETSKEENNVLFFNNLFN